MSSDLIKLTRSLIQRQSITPRDDGAIKIIKDKVKKLGFVNKDLPFGKKIGDDLVLNLYSLKKNKFNKSITLCFAGHTDVVPVGDETKWKYRPFCREG